MATTETAVKERPILFSGEMVRAIIEGRKTQTRRVIKPQPPGDIDEQHGNQLRKRAPYTLEHEETGSIIGEGFFDDDDRAYKCPYGIPGERLWVRETWCKLIDHDDSYAYRADGNADTEKLRKEYVECGYPYQWKPSIHMPRGASRILLEVTDLRVERVQSLSVSPEDAIAEGIEVVGKDAYGNIYRDYLNRPDMRCTAVGSFRSLWDSINEKRGFGWDANPWCWAVSFKLLEVKR